MSANLPDLGGTGLVLGLYEYLWTKNHLLQTRCMYHKCPPIQIPDTVFLKDKVPTAWYFSSLKSGTLQRRSKDLNLGKIAQVFRKMQNLDSDVMCLFVGSAPGSISTLFCKPLSRSSNSNSPCCSRR